MFPYSPSSVDVLCQDVGLFMSSIFYITLLCITLVAYMDIIIMDECRAWAYKQALVPKRGQDKIFIIPLSSVFFRLSATAPVSSLLSSYVAGT